MSLGKIVLQLEKVRKMSLKKQINFYFEEVVWDSTYPYYAERLELVIHPDGSYSAKETYLMKLGLNGSDKAFRVTAFGGNTLSEFLFEAHRYYLNYPFNE